MVVTSVRDYLRKKAEAADKPPSGTRESMIRMPSPGIHDGGSTVSTLIACVISQSIMLAKEWIANTAAGKIYRPSHFEEGHESEGMP